ncbi:hypothetical protein GCM10009712_29480 [Pseudarthrobacter sulfonivorans]
MEQRLLFAPRNPHSPAGNMQIATPRTPCRDAGQDLLFQSEGAPREVVREG